jgi:hypothetical protein
MMMRKLRIAGKKAVQPYLFKHLNQSPSNIADKQAYVGMFVRGINSIQGN